MDTHLNQRQREILTELRKAGGYLRVNAIAQALDVSDETIRRNIKELADNGAVEKMHGGVRLLGEDHESDFNQRLREQPEAKMRIAHHVAGMIEDGASLFLDIGSTTAFIADALCNHKRLLVVTNSVYIAYRLAPRNDNRVFMAGGELRGHDGGVFGADVMAFVDNFQTDYAILTAAGINAANGPMLFDLEEAQFSRRIMDRAATCIMAADASKFNREAPVTIGNPARVDYLVTERHPPKDITDAASEWGIEIQIAK